MNKAWFWITWIVAFLVINLAAVPAAVFILYGVKAGTGMFSAEYMEVVGIFLLINLITLQMLLASRKKDHSGFMIGLGTAFLQAVGLLVFISTISIAAILFTMLMIVSSAVLLVKELRWRRY